MKRRPGPSTKCVLLLLALLVAGASVNVAVAWGCYRFIDPTNASASRRSEFRWPPPPKWMEEIVWRKPGRENVEVSEWTWHGPWSLNEGGTRPTSEIVQRKQRAGFPLIAIEKRFTLIAPASNALESVRFRVVWIGFIANSLLYAIVLALISLSPVLRETHRVMRGMCPKCAYDLRGSESATCPECGARK